MGKVKKIALVTSASNFEKYKNVIQAIDEKLKQVGGYALYVFGCYGLFMEDTDYDKGEASVYSLLEQASFDGCIIEGNIGNLQMRNNLVKLFKNKNIPLVTLNFGAEDVPFYLMDSYNTSKRLVEHIIEEHKCTKINLAATTYDDIFVELALQGYADALSEHGLPVEEERVVFQTVSIPNGKALYHIFKERGVDDAEATVCVHDIFAIGLILEMLAQGLNIPKDMKICSLGRSVNSIVFRPDVTGADRGDVKTAKTACEGLVDILEGKEVALQNYTVGKIFYGESCGCKKLQKRPHDRMYQELILSKVEAGNQISRMMQYNDSLEKVHSLDELGESINGMINGINCKEFVFCLNQQALQYITNEIEEIQFTEGKYFDDTMNVLTGFTERTGELNDSSFPVKELLPVEAQDGDLFLFLPVHHKGKIFGYIAFVNETTPVEMYNYRICHESFGSSIENLHGQMILRQSIHELDELHMQDALTGIYNRFAWNRFSPQYVETGKYCVVMIDMDGLKKINDNFGHLAGNHAINITMEAIRSAITQEDLLIRYGGDEFQILSYNIDSEYWDNIYRTINEKLEAEVARQMLPYELGVSLGYCVCDEKHPLSMDECCEQADKRMYDNKKERKAQRVN